MQGLKTSYLQTALHTHTQGRAICKRSSQAASGTPREAGLEKLEMRNSFKVLKRRMEITAALRLPLAGVAKPQPEVL